MDNVSLRGMLVDFEKYKVITRTSEITSMVLGGEQDERAPYNLLSSEIISDFSSIDNTEKMSISIGGFVPYNPDAIPVFGTNTVDSIKIYTGEVPTLNTVIYYPGQERFTISKNGSVGINNPDVGRDRATLDVRSATSISTSPIFTRPPDTPNISITHPYYYNEGGGKGEQTPSVVGVLEFRSIQDPPRRGKTPIPTVLSSIRAETDGFTNIYDDPSLNLALYTGSGDPFSRVTELKGLEINGYENKTKIFPQLNLARVPVYRDQAEAVDEGQLVNGDVYQDREQNLKIVFIPDEEETAEKRK